MSPTRHDQSAPPTRTDAGSLGGKVREAIVAGAGITGIAASYYLAANGIDHLVLEKSAGVGGIWRTQEWPGIRCDTEIISYSYSFSPCLSAVPLIAGRKIARYLERVVDEQRIRERIHFGVDVERAEFDTRDSLWRIHTNAGVYRSRFLINANGYFQNTPHRPTFPGMAQFRGTISHLADLGPSPGLQAKKVVLVGSGASALTAAPVLSAQAARLIVLQRSPAYIYETDNRIGILTDLAQRAYRRGFALPVRLLTGGLRLKNDLIFVLFRKFPGAAKAIFRHHWRDFTGDAEAQTNFAPFYDPWEQRIVVAVGLKQALRSGKLQFVTGNIATFVPEGIRLDDGRQIEADTCLLATGYDVNLFKFEILVDGKKVDTKLINFYKGMMMGGIPNYFHPFGVVHASWTNRIESVARLMAKIISYMRRKNFTTVSIDRKQVQQRPRITPNYIMRSLHKLPAFYGTWELPTVDNLLFFIFQRANYRFSGTGDPLAESGDGINDAVTLRAGADARWNERVM